MSDAKCQGLRVDSWRLNTDWTTAGYNIGNQCVEAGVLCRGSGV